MPRPCQPLRGLLSQVVSNQSGGAVTQLRLDVKEHTVTAKYRTESSGTLSLYPFFFVKAENGSLLEVLHHPDETSESLGVKKVLVSSHQLVVPSRQFRSTSGDSERWEVAEEDASGGSRANYTSRRGLFGRTTASVAMVSSSVWRLSAGSSSRTSPCASGTSRWAPRSSTTCSHPSRARSRGPS